MTHYWLSIHADYACHHSGACCSSNWTIPVEPELIPVLGSSVAAGFLPMTADGACVFFDRAAARDRCNIQRRLGLQALPVSCRHFPRVCLLDARGVSVTLSHYCPTAAALLFRRDRALKIVVGPDPVPGGTIEGLDARAAMPPLLSPSVLMEHDSYAGFERFMIGAFANEAATAEMSLAAIDGAVERLRGWTADGESLGALVASLESEAGSWTRSVPDCGLSAVDLVLFDEVCRSVPPPHAWDLAPGEAEASWRRAVADGWEPLARPVRHYLAAKAFASWLSYQGQGLRTLTRSLHAALSVLKIEVLRLALDRAGGVDESLLKEAFRRADLLLVHLADREKLARIWSKAERTSRGSAPLSSW